MSGPPTDSEKQVSLSLEAAQRRTRELEQVAAAAIDAVSANLCVLDPNGRVLTVNRSWLDYWEQHQTPGCEKPYPMDANYLEICEQAQGPSLEGASQMAQAIRAVSAGEKDREVVEYPCHEPGRRRWFNAVVTRFRGEAANLVVVHEDVTERKLAEERRDLLEGRLRLSEKLEAVGTVAGGIAHDFNNILSAILGYTQLAREDAEGNEAVLESLDEVKQASVRAVSLIKKLVTSTNQLDHRGLVPLRLGPLVDATMSLLRPAVPSNVQFQVSSCPSLLPVLADAGLLHQALTNLIRNADQAIGASPGTIKVSLTNVELEDQTDLCKRLKPGRFVSLSVSDSGHGMDESTLARIFDPFFTTQGKRGGQGLGLSVVHQVVKNHRGTVRARSEVGRGATFELLLPALPAETAVPSVSDAYKVSAEKAVRIMLVDDEISVGKVAATLLKRQGYLVDLETVAEDALDLLLSRTREYSLLITDLTMPRLSGLELARKVHQELPELPILLASGRIEHLTSEMLDSAGIGQVLDKPFSAEDLVESVHRALDT